jgi:hypothetical protein
LLREVCRDVQLNVKLVRRCLFIIDTHATTIWGGQKTRQQKASSLHAGFIKTACIRAQDTLTLRQALRRGTKEYVVTEFLIHLSKHSKAVTPPSPASPFHSASSQLSEPHLFVILSAKTVNSTMRLTQTSSTEQTFRKSSHHRSNGKTGAGASRRDAGTDGWDL